MKICFLVFPLRSEFNCILEHPTLASLDVVASTVHLKLKYHGSKGDAVTILADVRNARKCLSARGKIPTEKTNPRKLPSSECQSTGETDLKA